jgi:hypothetical protein
MFEMVTKDKVPSKKFKESHKDETPTPEELKALCAWAQSFQMDKK